MSGDKLVFDLANEVEDVPNIFVRKDWINILDNQNGNYNGNQCVIDTSQLSNSNKYMGYREGYLVVPLLLTLTSSNGEGVLPTTANKSADFSIGLKNWFGSIVHSMTLDFNGTTIIQQTPFVNMYNSFKLMTTLSWQEVYCQGSTMGFYPDDPLSWTFRGANSLDGKGVCNNTNMRAPYNVLGPRIGINTSVGSTSAAVGTLISGENQYSSGLGNKGFLKRQMYINYDSAASSGSATFGAALNDSGAANLWKSHIITKTSSLAGSGGVYQIAITATIHLRHLHSFFNQIPLIKGAFMKLTLNLNNCTTVFTSAATTNVLGVTSVSNAIGGVNPVMISSADVDSIGAVNAGADAVNLQFFNGFGPMNKQLLNRTALGAEATYTVNISVGSRCLNPSQSGVGVSTMSNSVVLYVPSYSMNSVFEQAYISSPIKKIIYEDLYQYQILNVAGSGNINSLITNGIANLRSCLVLPFYSQGTNANLCADGVPCYQSPFDPAGCGPTSPLCVLTNFNVVISGQNALYNTQRYSFETFLNQVQGCNAVNANMTDGIGSSLISHQDWEMEYCYHYVDISRMLPVEQFVPKSVTIIGSNTSNRPIDLIVFLAYGKEISLDILSGSRVS